MEGCRRNTSTGTSILQITMASEAGDTLHNRSRVPVTRAATKPNDGAVNIFASWGTDLGFDNGGNELSTETVETIP